MPPWPVPTHLSIWCVCMQRACTSRPALLSTCQHLIVYVCLCLLRIIRSMAKTSRGCSRSQNRRCGDHRYSHQGFLTAKRTDVLVPANYVISHTASSQLCEREHQTGWKKKKRYTRLPQTRKSTKCIPQIQCQVWLIASLCNRCAILSSSLYTMNHPCLSNSLPFLCVLLKKYYQNVPSPSDLSSWAPGEKQTE